MYKLHLLVTRFRGFNVDKKKQMYFQLCLEVRRVRVTVSAHECSGLHFLLKHLAAPQLEFYA